LRPNPYLASLLSLFVPGLGQIYAGRGERGARILFAAIVIGNLNVIWLSIHGLVPPGQGAFWASGLPRILHDVFAAWAVVFWAWAVWDAYGQARGRHAGP
jgi:TM2 domain-containing membrane protein YozV